MFTSQTSRGGYNLSSEPDLKYSESTINFIELHHLAYVLVLSIMVIIVG